MSGTTDSVDATTDAAAELSQEIGKMLAGRGEVLQGAVLADLVATWVAGHNPAIRERALAIQISCIRDLIPECAREIAERHGLKGWV